MYVPRAPTCITEISQVSINKHSAINLQVICFIVGDVVPNYTHRLTKSLLSTCVRITLRGLIKAPVIFILHILAITTLFFFLKKAKHQDQD